MRGSIRALIGAAAATAGLLALSLPAASATATAPVKVTQSADYDYDYDWGPYESYEYHGGYAQAYGTVYSDDYYDDYVHVTGKLYDYAYKKNTCAFIKIKAEGYRTNAFYWCGKGYYQFHKKYDNPETIDVQVCLAKKYRSHGDWKYKYDYCGDWETIYDYSDREDY